MPERDGEGVSQMNEHIDEGTIHAWLDGQLSPDESARVEAHIAGCAECSALVAEARGYVAAASRIVGALDGVPAKVIPARRRGIQPWQLRAAAVVVVMVLGTAVFLRESRMGATARLASYQASRDVATSQTAVPTDSVAKKVKSSAGSPAEADKSAVPVAKALSDQERQRSDRASAHSAPVGQPVAPAPAPATSVQTQSAAAPAATAPAATAPPPARAAARMAEPLQQSGAEETYARKAQANNNVTALDAATNANAPVAKASDELKSEKAPAPIATLAESGALGGRGVAPTGAQSVCAGSVVNVVTRAASDSAPAQSIAVRLAGAGLNNLKSSLAAVAPEAQSSGANSVAASGALGGSAGRPQAPPPVSAPFYTGTWTPLGSDSAIVDVTGPGGGRPVHSRVSCRP
jgi:anti-sigma factor RsiW